MKKVKLEKCKCGVSFNVATSISKKKCNHCLYLSKKEAKDDYARLLDIKG